MSNGNDVSGDIAKKFYAVKPKQLVKQEIEQKENLQKQDPSQMTGVQWAQAANLQQANIQKHTGGRTLESKSAPKPGIVAPDIEDMAFITTQVSIREESVESPVSRTLRSIGIKFNLDTLGKSFKDSFRQSKSHNLLLERFMANVKFSGMKRLLSALGVSAEEQAGMQGEVRNEALKEIDQKLGQDWAFTKAMIEITS